MPEQSGEPEKYSIDDMMDRLNGRNPSENQPELVTRRDGSQAMKVRKRKRRTKQELAEKNKRNHRIRVIQFAGFAVLLVLLGLAAGIGIINANSTSFRESLLGKLEDSSGAKVSLNQFRMNPASANANEVDFEWPEGNALAGLRVQAVKAKIAPASFLGRAFSGEEIVAARGKLTLRAPGDLHSIRHRAAPEGESSVMFQRYSIPVMDIFFGDADGARRFLKGTEVSLFPGAASGQAEVRLRGGLFEFDEWPPMTLDRSYIKVIGDVFQIQNMRFTVPRAANDKTVDKGFMDFTGSISPLEAGATHTLQASVQDLRLSCLVGSDFSRFLIGNVDAREIPNSNFLTFSPATPESAVLELTLTNSADSRINLGGFRFLSQLSAVLDDSWYEFPNFDDEVTLIVKRAGAGVSVEGIKLASRGRMAVRGSVTNSKDGGISGKLRIGLPETMIAASEDKRLDLMFGQVREGYRWLDLEVGGTSPLPEDNFREQYLKAPVSPDESPIDDEGKQDQFDKLIEEGE